MLLISSVSSVLRNNKLSLLGKNLQILIKFCKMFGFVVFHRKNTRKEYKNK